MLDAAILAGDLRAERGTRGTESARQLHQCIRPLGILPARILRATHHERIVPFHHRSHRFIMPSYLPGATENQYLRSFLSMGVVSSRRIIGTGHQTRTRHRTGARIAIAGVAMG